MFVIGRDNLINFIIDDNFCCKIDKPKYFYKFTDGKINSIINNDNFNVEIKDNIASFKYVEDNEKITPEEFDIMKIKTLIIDKQMNNYNWLKHFKNVDYILINKCDIDLNILTDLKNLKVLCFHGCNNIILPKNLNPEKLSFTNCKKFIIPDTYKNVKILDIAERTYDLPNYLTSLEELYYYVGELKEIPKEYTKLKKLNLLFDENNTKMLDVFNYIKNIFLNFKNIKEINVFNCYFKEKEFKDNINMLFFKDKTINFYVCNPYGKLIKNSYKLYYNTEYNISYFGCNVFAEILMKEGLL